VAAATAAAAAAFNEARNRRSTKTPARRA
jgi:hypothetical protein